MRPVPGWATLWRLLRWLSQPSLDLHDCEWSIRWNGYA